MVLKVGDIAPAFELMDQNLKKVKLADFAGKTVVLLFYPMDFSPICTAEHCGWGPALGQIAPTADTVVFGVNCDHSFSHQAFKKQFNIPYDLLADTSREMSRAYEMFSGVEPFNCAKRGTVVIGPDGRVKHVSVVGVEDVRSPDAIAAAVKA